MQLGAAKADQRFESANRGGRAQDPASVRAYNLRLPPNLKTALALAATENGRSLNAEIVHRLRGTLEGYRQF